MAYAISKSLNVARASSQNATINNTFGLSSYAAFTAEFTFRLASLPAVGEAYALGTIGWATIGVHFTIFNDAGVYKLRITRHSWFTSTTSLTYTFSPTAGTWYHVAFTKDSGANAAIFLNGASVATGSIGTSTGSTLTAGSSIGAMYNNGSYVNYFNGDISISRIWSGVRTASEILDNICTQYGTATLNLQAEYSFNEVYTDASGNAYTLTAVNSPTFTSNVSATCSLAIVTTSAASSIGLTTANLNGEVVTDNGATITQRGFVYAVSTGPTTANSKVIVSGTTGIYSGAVSGLSPNTEYFVRAYAINSRGTSYGNEITFTSGNVEQYEIQKEIGAAEGEEYIGRINVTGTVGTITVKLGTTGAETIIAAGSGNSVFSGAYSGISGLIITRSADFDGAIDDVFYTKVPVGTTVDWDSDFVVVVTAISSSVFFSRIEDKEFNVYRLYRFLDLLFKDLDGYVTVTIKEERDDSLSSKSTIFSVGNTSNPASPFSKKKISFLCKDQALIIGLSNASLDETFSIAKYVVSGHKAPKRMFGADKIISV